MQSNNKAIYLVGGLAFAAYFGTQLVSRSKAQKVLAAQTIEDAVPTVSVVHAKLGEANRTITLPGNVEAWFQAPIYAQVSGYVKMWYKDYGAEVKKGDVLAEINAPALEAQYEQAKADLEAARAKFNIAGLTAKRYEAMRKSNAVPVQAINVVEADAKVAEAKLNAAMQHVRNYEALIRFTTIVAPYDGVVISRDINVGDYVTKEGDLGGTGKGSSLFMVADMHRMRLFVSVPESFGQFMRPGLHAEVTVPQLPTRKFVADFVTVAKGFRPSTRTAITEFAINNDDRALWPGSFASVKVTATVDHPGYVIPATSMVFDENGTQVALLSKENKVHFQPIAVTKVLDSEVELSEGVGPEDAIIDAPSAALLEGDTVRAVTPAPGIKI